MNELDCKDIKALLSGLIDGEVDDPTRHRAERHLADCTACRNMINEVESLNGLLKLEAQRQMEGGDLPPGFENAVLRQTVYAEAYQFAGRRWTSWIGWMAAAACLSLAVSLWFLNPRGIQSQNPLVARSSPSNPTMHTAAYPTGGKSWTYDGGLSAEAINKAGARAASTVDDQVLHRIDNQLAGVFPAGLWSTPLSDAEQSAPISRDDADTLYAASNVLDMLTHADLKSFADADRIRQIAEYDDLVNRLMESRNRLAAQDRPAVLAAESVLLRVVNGPLSLDDLRILRDTVANLKLASRMESISSRWQGDSAL